MGVRGATGVREEEEVGVRDGEDCVAGVGLSMFVSEIFL